MARRACSSILKKLTALYVRRGKEIPMKYSFMALLCDDYDWFKERMLELRRRKPALASALAPAESDSTPKWTGSPCPQYLGRFPSDACSPHAAALPTGSPVV